jgi:hypothetical protein
VNCLRFVRSQVAMNECRLYGGGSIWACIKTAMTRLGDMVAKSGERQRPHVQLRHMGHPVLPVNVLDTFKIFYD